MFCLQDNVVASLTDRRKVALQNAKENILVAQMKQKEMYHRKHSNPPKFAVGNKVLKKDFLRKKRKGGCMDYKWLGPYEVMKDVGKGFFSLKDMENGKIVNRIHGAHLKVYRTPLNSPSHNLDHTTRSSVVLSPFNPSNDIILSPFNPNNDSVLSSFNHSNDIILSPFNPDNDSVLSSFNHSDDVMLSPFNPDNHSDDSVIIII